MEQRGLYRNCIKRILDAVLSALALLLLSPVLLLTALLVRFKLGSPVFFRQPRPGQKEKVFDLIKFRSMTNEKGEDGKLLPDAKRLTRFGKILRATSLDELPELWNILKGDMSFVGPRPLSVYYLPHYPKEFRRRHDVRPGLTGLAQVNGRNNLPWDERFRMDIQYVDGVSFLMDLRILLKTVGKVLKRSDVTVRGETKVQDYGPWQILREEGGKGEKEARMTYSEIGSYFWLDGTEECRSQGTPEWLPKVSDQCFTFSGRNAIDLAVRDILSERDVKRVFVPSYSCVSMLQAFLDRGIRVEFYRVGFEDGLFTYELPDADRNSAVLIMSYFGLSAKNAHEAVSALHAKGAVIIEDITHSLFLREAYSEHSDYLVASLRKWFAAPAGGFLGKRSGMLSEKPDQDGDQAVSAKTAAMREKWDYLNGKTDSKEHFLLEQAKFENDLIHVDRLLQIDTLSLRITEGTDAESLAAKRRENAEVLLGELRDLDGSILSLPKTDLTKDVPLFLPVFLKTQDRDALRAYLIEKGIYCPVHWPEVMGAGPGIRDQELSLVVDQRYSKEDMRETAGEIRRFFGTATH